MGETKKSTGNQMNFFLDEIKKSEDMKGSEGKHRQQSRYSEWKIQFFSLLSFKPQTYTPQSLSSHLHHVKREQGERSTKKRRNFFQHAICREFV